MRATASRLAVELGGHLLPLAVGVGLGCWLAWLVFRWRIRRAVRGTRRRLRLLDQTDMPMLLADVDGRISWCNKLARQAQHGPSPTLPAHELAAAVRQCRSDFGSQEVRIAGRSWNLLVMPLLALGGRRHGDIQRLLCLQDMESGEVGRARSALRHIAHDLRTPLVSMLSLIDERAAPAGGGATLDEQVFLDELRRQTDYSLRISRDFLQLARAEQIDRSSFGVVELEDVAAEAMDHLWLAAEQKSVQLIGPLCTTGDTRVHGNASILIRALANLLDNAIKYSPAGSSVRVRVQPHVDGRLLVQVIDQGCGISAEDLPLVFEPLFQAAGHRERQQGVGLGLPFVKRVVEQHDGEIVLISMPGQGTEARLLLPLA